MSEKAERIAPYTVLVVQPEVTVVKKREDIRKTLDRVCNLIHFGVGYFRERPGRLVVLPEYFMQGAGTPGKPPRSLSEKVSICKEVFDDLHARGQFTPPAGYAPEQAMQTPVYVSPIDTKEQPVCP